MTWSSNRQASVAEGVRSSASAMSFWILDSFESAHSPKNLHAVLA